jgi:quercetin dioxygenase-like cupin family protein
MEFISYSVKFQKQFHPKGWGGEYWIVNFGEYCGKILQFEKGKRFSWHYHEEKVETFHLLRGYVQLIVGVSDEISEAESLFLEPGDSFHIPAGLRHQVFAIEKSEILEISTFHHELDSIRIERGD